MALRPGRSALHQLKVLILPKTRRRSAHNTRRRAAHNTTIRGAVALHPIRGVVALHPEPRPRHLDTILDMIPRHLDTLASTITRHTDTNRYVQYDVKVSSLPRHPQHTSTHLDTPSIDTSGRWVCALCGKLSATRMQPEAHVWICCRRARLVSYVQSTAKLEMVQKASTF